MRITRIVSAFVVVAVLVGRALAAEPLSLGQGTACVLMPEREAKAKLGVKKRHVLACADATGKVVRVVITRKGTVECSDAVQVASDGSATNAAPCRAVKSAHEATVPPVVNISGAWATNVDTLDGLVTCVSQVAQDGGAITVAATCDIFGFPGDFSGSGSIAFEGYTFSARGPAYVPGWGPCGIGGIDATIAPDGQSMSGTLTCDSIVVTFSARRT
jgi:hypothetical protein